MNISNKVSQSKTLYILLGLSLLYFALKGISYALIGSYVPILFITVVIVFTYISFGAKQKTHYRFVKFWAVLIIIWAVIRLGLSIILEFDTTLTESHLREQFGFIPQLLSIGILIIGIGIFKQLKKQKNLQKEVL